MDFERTVKDYLSQVIHMSLATVGEGGRPWVCEVHFAFDDELNLYWVSMGDARHSQEVKANPQVAGTIAVQHFLDQMPRAVSFEGTAEVLEDVTPEHPAYKTYVARFPSRAQVITEAYTSDDPNGRRIYKVTVSDYYLVDGIATGKLEKHHMPWKR